MFTWIAAHSDQLSVIVSGITAFVWIVYLQLFLATYLRQRRWEILVTAGGGQGLGARCFISNLSLEPIYVSDIQLCLFLEDETLQVMVTDREEARISDLGSPRDGTLQGPLKSAEIADAGSFDDLLTRARRLTGRELDVDNLKGMKVTVIATAASKGTIIAAERCFDIADREKNARVKPTTLRTRQIRSVFARRRLERELESKL